MKKVLSFAIIFCMLFVMVSCGKEPAPANSGTNDTSKTDVSDSDSNGSTSTDTPLKVGFSLPSMTFPFYVRMYDQIVEEAEARGWEVTFVDGNLDAGTQMNGCQDLINSHVDVMIIATWFIDAMVDVFDQCKENDIPVFLMDNMIIPSGAEDDITFSTGTDNYNAGAVGGVWYANYLKEQGINSIKLVTVSAQSEQQTKRCSGFTDTLSENGIDVNILNVYDGGKRETSMAACEDALTAYSDLELIYGGSAQDSLGGYDATTGANRTGVQIIGFDGEDEELELIDKGTNYLATITQDPKGQALLVVDRIEKWRNGETFEQLEETPAGVYCAEGQLSGSDILN